VSDTTVNLSAVLDLVAAELGVRRIVTRSRGNRRRILARQLAAYVAVVQLGVSRAAVGHVFRRDARSIGRAIERIEDARDNRHFDEIVLRLERAAAALGTCVETPPDQPCGSHAAHQFRNDECRDVDAPNP